MTAPSVQISSGAAAPRCVPCGTAAPRCVHVAQPPSAVSHVAQPPPAGSHVAQPPSAVSHVAQPPSAVSPCGTAALGCIFSRGTCFQPVPRPSAHHIAPKTNPNQTHPIKPKTLSAASPSRFCP